jgi:serine protease AprX
MRKRAVVVTSFLLLLAIQALGTPAAAQLLPPLGPPPPPPEILAKLDPLLHSLISSPTGQSDVIVRARDADAIGLVASLIQLAGGAVGRQLGIIDAMVARVPNSALASLAGNPLVRRIALDRLIAGTMERTGATTGAAAARQAFGYDGSGIGVAVIDSGVTSWHDDLTEAGVPGSQRVDRFVDFVNEHSEPYDDYGHGTHVAGIIAGNGWDSGGARSGIAPGVRLMVLKVLDSSGRGRISSVIAAFDYVVRHRHPFHIRVVNLSVATGVFESYNSDLLTLAAKRAVEAGLVVVASAGNAGRESNGRTVYGAITAPGNAPWVLTVGASSHMGTIDRSDDTVAGFSSRGPTAIDRTAKPDLVAPGVGIESLSDPQSSLFASKSPYLLNGTTQTTYPPYLSLSGTSQAAPVVAGTVALMLQANPALTPNAVKAILQYTSETNAGYDPLTQGAGFINAHGAIELARFLAAPDTTSLPSTTAWSRSLVWGNRRVLVDHLTSDASAWGTDVEWGASATPAGHGISWGNGPSHNVVWGLTCGGANCQGTHWTTDPTVVWGTDAGETVVWGTGDDGETVVWGTGDDGETVVWGTSGDTNVVWGTGSEEQDAGPAEAGHHSPPEAEHNNSGTIARDLRAITCPPGFARDALGF